MRKAIIDNRNHTIGVKPPIVVFKAAVTIPTIRKTITRTRIKFHHTDRFTDADLFSMLHLLIFRNYTSFRDWRKYILV
jgi:hypothetical protein